VESLILDQDELNRLHIERDRQDAALAARAGAGAGVLGVGEGVGVGVGVVAVIQPMMCLDGSRVVRMACEVTAHLIQMWRLRTS
jgi:hypothetical protein